MYEPLLNKPFYAFFFCCAFLSCTVLSGQTSIYQDSKELADFLKIEHRPILDFSKIDSVSKFMRMDGQELYKETIDKKPKHFPLPTFDAFGMALREKDTMIVHFMDTTLEFSYSQNFEIDILVFSFSPNFFRIEKNDKLVFEQEVGLGKTLDLLYAYKNLNRGNNSSYSSSFRKTYDNYSENEFIRDLGTEQKVFNDAKDIYYFPHELQYDIEPSTKKKPPTHDWLDLMYGDSTLDLRRKVSFADVEAGYRSPSISSKTELDKANVDMNKLNTRRSLLDAQTVAVGLSDFIAERAQEELNLTFFDRFRKNLQDTSELTVLFPETKSLLESFEISDYKTLLANARGSFTTDLENLGLHFPNILKLKKYADLDNSPDIYNLSLIYTIANLAYQEVPVEDILILTYQKLRDREMQLTKTIDLKIAELATKDKVLNSTQFHSNSMVPTSSIPNVQILNNLTENYLEQRAKADVTVDSILSKLSETAIELEDSLIENPSGVIQKLRDPIDALVDLNSDEWEAQNMFCLMPHEPWEEAETKNEYYKKTLLAHLSGKVDYAMYANGTSLIQYEMVFGKEPAPPKENIAKGLNELRFVLKEPCKDYYQKRIEKASEIAKETRDLRSKMHYMSKDEQDIGYIINDVSRKGAYLKLALNEEIQFWETVSAKKPDTRASFHIAGLNYLLRILNQDGILRYTLEWPNTYSIFYSKKKKVLIQELCSESNEKFDFVLKNLKYQTDKLLDIYGMMPMNSTTFSQKKTSFKNVLHYFETKLQSNEIELQFQIDRDSLHSEKPNEEQTYEERGIYLRSKTNALMEEAEAKINALPQEYLVEPSLTFVFPDTLQSNKTLQDFYSLDKNQGIYNITQSVGFGSTSDSSIRHDYKLIEGYIEILNKQIVELDSIETSIREQLVTIEKNYTPNLYKARENAHQLGKSIEVSTHILFAFRDYDKAGEPIKFLDSMNVHVISNKVDTTSGYVLGTEEIDTIRVQERKLIETKTEQQAARWISQKQFEELRADDIRWNAFLGLLYQRLNSIEELDNFSPDGTALLATKFIDIAHQMDKHRTTVRIKKATHPETVSFQDYYPFIRSTVDLFNTTITTQSIGNQSFESLYPSLSKIPKISDDALSMYENIYAREYGTAILNAMNLLSTVSNVKMEENAHESIKEKALKRKNLRDVRRTQRTIRAILLYGTFMSDMIQAESSNQVKVILKKTTLPAGTSRVKRETRRSITINSYLGVAVAQDQLLEAPDAVNARSMGAALSVPIGLTYSTSPNWIKNNSSFSFHFPLLDLGAITAYRQNPNNDNYSVNSLPELSWKNLFSPGFFGIYNFANSPFSVGVGGQYGPQLREIQVGTGDPIFLNSWRFPMVFFDIDVPLFNLHTGEKKVVVD